MRPNATGSSTTWTTQFPNSGSHFDKVYEESSDGDTTYVATQNNSATTKYDLFHIPDSAIPETATINFVKVYVICRNTDSGAAIQPGKVQEYIRVAGTNYTGNNNYPEQTYTSYSKTWTVNPKTDLAWTISDINSLEIGASGNSAIDDPELPGVWYPVRLTQVYVEIDYSEGGAEAPRSYSSGDGLAWRLRY